MAHVSTHQLTLKMHACLGYTITIVHLVLDLSPLGSFFFKMKFMLKGCCFHTVGEFQWVSQVVLEVHRKAVLSGSAELFGVTGN